ncbi:hypothetical protein D3C80_1857890 [compost metagenome]
MAAVSGFALLFSSVAGIRGEDLRIREGLYPLKAVDYRRGDRDHRYSEYGYAQLPS